MPLAATGMDYHTKCPACSSSAQSRSNTVVLTLAFRLLGPTPGQFAFLYKSPGNADAADRRTDLENV